jgi:TonB family protein
MTGGLVWSNVVAYSLQVGLLVGIAGCLPALLRVRLPKARLVFLQLLLLACLLLPLVRPWRSQTVSGLVQVSQGPITPEPARGPEKRLHISGAEVALAVLGAGFAARMGLLALGFWQLRRYRRNSEPLNLASGWEATAEFRLSADVPSPVTFGLMRPVVLLPHRFLKIDTAMQNAILCHEGLHVLRRDWLFTLAEELVRAVFWFHPAIWWLLGEIQLAREQAVDREVVQTTRARDPYVDALLAIAGAAPLCDLAPAPLFLRKRQLKQRILAILKEAQMSNTRLTLTLAAGLAALGATCWMVTGAFPLLAAPQMPADAPGVSVDTGGAQLMHRAGIPYPSGAAAKHIQGTVVAQLKLDENGSVVDAAVLSGPEELRKAVLESALNWHFAKESAGSTRQIAVTFEAPADGGTADAPASQAAPQRVHSNSTLHIKSIAIRGLSDAARDELLSRLPAREGDTINSDTLVHMQMAIRNFDEHLVFRIAGTKDFDIVISPPSGPATQPRAPSGPIAVGGRIQAAMLLEHPDPVYPQEAKQAGVSGHVLLDTVIGPDGHVTDIHATSGPALLHPAAIDAVKQWVYKPTLLNGEPVAVRTTIDVNFTLTQ